MTTVAPERLQVLAERFDGIPTQWLDPVATEASIGWTREVFEAITPDRAGGRWLNYYDDDEDSVALDAAYGANRRRLGEVKRRYDPDNVFHHNQNIAPAAAEES